MKLYYFPLSTYSQKALIALYEKDAAFEPQLVDLRDERARETYRELYPLGKVPLLVLADGHMIPESSIIIEYIDARFERGPRLIPEHRDPGRRVRFLDRMVDLYVDESVATLLFQSWKPEEERNQELVAQSRFRLGVMYPYLDKELQGKSWLAGEEFSLADCALAPVLAYARDVAPFEEHAHLAAYWERVQGRPSYVRVLEEAAPYLEALKNNAA